MIGHTTVITAPAERHENDRGLSIFLAGSIDMGAAENWQQDVIDRLDKVKGHSGPHIIYNPRRATWTAGTDITTTNPDFVTQVEWELHYIRRAKVVFFNFVPGGLAPITLLELGLVAGCAAEAGRFHEKVIICCPPGYWRAGNVEVVAGRFGFDFYTDFETAYQRLYDLVRDRYA